MQVNNQWDPKLNVRLGKPVAEGRVRTIGLELPKIGKKAELLKGLWGLRMLCTEPGNRWDYWMAGCNGRRIETQGPGAGVEESSAAREGGRISRQHW